MMCERCGSVSIRRVKANPLERLLRFFTGKKRFFCKRCGWTGLRVWDENAPRVMQPRKSELRLVGVSAHAHHAELDPRR